MNTLRKCLTCNWEYPPTYNRNKCKYCGGSFDVPYISGPRLPTEVKCLKCLETKPADQFNLMRHRGRLKHRDYCKSCEKLRHKERQKRNPETYKASVRRRYLAAVDRINKKYEEWLETSDVPFKVLSEKEWLDTCRYFGGCAVCGSDAIEARTFFVPFKEGGKYAAWNMIPVCGTCGTEATLTSNPFKWLKGANARKLGMTPERAVKIVDYLEQQIERARL